MIQFTDNLTPIDRITRLWRLRQWFETLSDKAEQELHSEICRLQNLARLNPAVDKQEIKNLQTHQTAIEEALAETRFRLDALHLIILEK